MAKGFKRDRDKDVNLSARVEGINILTDKDFGVYVEGAEKTIEMYERGDITRDQLYDSILDLEVVYKSVESSKE